MRRYSEAVKADVRRRMSPPHRQSVARISEELGIHVITLYKWRKTWRLQGEVVPASEKEPEGWSPPASGKKSARSDPSTRGPNRRP
ncbi:transposase [Cyanobium sp. BSA11S]|uniref:transposase n=1 Tax=Cyanobium sp. BSA11S TaxID=3108224 RepID=UPI003D8157CB